jgi:hypothetical protein
MAPPLDEDRPERRERADGSGQFSIVHYFGGTRQRQRPRYPGAGASSSGQTFSAGQVRAVRGILAGAATRRPSREPAGAARAARFESTTWRSATVGPPLGAAQPLPSAPLPAGCAPTSPARARRSPWPARRCSAARCCCPADATWRGRATPLLRNHGRVVPLPSVDIELVALGVPHPDRVVADLLLPGQRAGDGGTQRCQPAGLGVD